MLTMSTLGFMLGVMPAKLQRKPKGAYHHGDLERALLEAALRTIRAVERLLAFARTVITLLACGAARGSGR